jgi:hypothetical protein
MYGKTYIQRGNEAERRVRGDALANSQRWLLRDMDALGMTPEERREFFQVCLDEGIAPSALMWQLKQAVRGG